MQAYSSETALDAAKNPNFDPQAFAASGDTVYIHAPAEEQAAAAPLVCGLLAEIRRATYQAHRNRALPRSVLFALDEAANIAPLEELPAIASEGGGQGLILLAAFQDLSQARRRWEQAADGFLTLFGTKLILPGIADSRTIDAISLALGEYDRQLVSRSSGRTGGPAGGRTSSRTISTQRTRVLSPGRSRTSLPATGCTSTGCSGSCSRLPRRTPPSRGGRSPSRRPSSARREPSFRPLRCGHLRTSCPQH